jgi:hypothetical protein
MQMTQDSLARLIFAERWRGAGFSDCYDDASETAKSEYLRIAQAVLAAMGWRDIKDAPVNESVLVWIPNREHYGDPVYRGLQVDMGTGKHWQVNGLSMGRDLANHEQPTHFMPLPLPPGAQS